MTRDLFGLKVEVDGALLEEFSILRSVLEPIMRKYKNILNEKEHTTIDSNFVKVPGNNPYYLTFSIVGKNIFLGLYDKNKKSVTDTCNYGDIRSLGVSEMNRLAVIIENYVKSNVKMPSLNALDIAWKEELLRRKNKELEQGKEGKEDTSSFIDFNSIVERSLAANPPPKSEKHSDISRNSRSDGR